jgi:hypothetical protein
MQMLRGALLRLSRSEQHKAELATSLKSPVNLYLVEESRRVSCAANHAGLVSHINHEAKLFFSLQTRRRGERIKVKYLIHMREARA